MIAKVNRNRGFSLIELIIVLAVLSVLGTLFFMNPGIVGRKEVDQYAKELCSQITLMQTISMARTGQWRLSMYERDGSYYCVQEKRDPAVERGGESEKTPVWVSVSGEIVLGSNVDYVGTTDHPTAAAEFENENGQIPLFVWRFNRDTGACLQGAGTYRLSGAGKTKQIKVYGQSGRCEEKAVAEEPTT